MVIVELTEVGLERIGRQALIALVAGLNDTIREIESIWAPLDEELATVLERVYVPTKLELVSLNNFHLGHRESLIEASIDAYPNVCCMAYQANPDPETDRQDYIDVYSDQLFVEIMAKGQDEDTANRRAQRMAEAVIRVIHQDRTLGGVVNEISSTPSVTITDVFPRREDKGHGPTWWWQLARVEWNVQKNAVLA